MHSVRPLRLHGIEIVLFLPCKWSFSVCSPRILTFRPGFNLLMTVLGTSFSWSLVCPLKTWRACVLMRKSYHSRRNLVHALIDHAWLLRWIHRHFLSHDLSSQYSRIHFTMKNYAIIELFFQPLVDWSWSGFHCETRKILVGQFSDFGTIISPTANLRRLQVEFRAVAFKLANESRALKYEACASFQESFRFIHVGESVRCVSPLLVWNIHVPNEMPILSLTLSIFVMHRFTNSQIHVLDFCATGAL